MCFLFFFSADLANLYLKKNKAEQHICWTHRLWCVCFCAVAAVARYSFRRLFLFWWTDSFARGLIHFCARESLSIDLTLFSFQSALICHLMYVVHQPSDWNNYTAFSFVTYLFFILHSMLCGWITKLIIMVCLDNRNAMDSMFV